MILFFEFFVHFVANNNIFKSFVLFVANYRSKNLTQDNKNPVHPVILSKFFAFYG